MRKTMIFSLFLLLFLACGKECEKDNTAILSVRNFTESEITVFIEGRELKTIQAGKEVDIPIDLVRKDGSEIYQTTIDYKIEGKFENETIILNQCETTTVTIK